MEQADTREPEHSESRPPAPAGIPETGQAQQDKPAAAQNTQRQPSTDPVALQAAFTRKSQELAQVKEILGLKSTATLDDVRAAVTPPAHAETTAEYDPVVERERAALREEAWGYVAEAKGPEVVAQVRQLEDLVYAGGTPSQLTNALLELAASVTRPTNGQPAPAPAQAAAPVDIQVEGDRAVGWHVQPEPDEIGSGDVEGAASRMFAKLLRR
jgi:hypothetical protein